MQFSWVELGTEKPIYTVIANNEKQAIKKLNRYLEIIGKSEIKLVRMEVRDEKF